MSRPRSIYVVSMDLFFSVIFILIVINFIISWKQTHLFFALFAEYILLILDKNEMKVVDDFLIAQI